MRRLVSRVGHIQHSRLGGILPSARQVGRRQPPPVVGPTRNWLGIPARSDGDTRAPAVAERVESVLCGASVHELEGRWGRGLALTDLLPHGA
eukprot:scaffold12168_cov86-Isochrysis_galbana.AAC.4